MGPMSYDDALADRVRTVLADVAAGDTGITEKRVVGGALGFLKDGTMVVGIDAKGLFVRVGKQGYAAARAEPHAGPKLVGDRETSGFVSIDPAGTATDDDLRRWVVRGLRFAARPKG